MTSTDGSLPKEKTTYSEDILMMNGADGLCSDEQAAVDAVLNNNRPVGIAIGVYDSSRTITMMSNFFLYNLGYTLDEYNDDATHSLLPFIYEDDRELFEREDFKDLEGHFEFRLVNKAGERLFTYAYKTDCVSATGERQWVISARVSRETIATHKLISGLDRLVARYVICDIPHNTFSFFVCGSDEAYMERGVYPSFGEGMVTELNLINHVDTLDHALSPASICARLKSYDGLYRYDYADEDNEIFYRLSVMPIEYDAEGNLSQYLVLVMDVTHIHAEEMRTKQALADACAAANRANEAKTRFLSNMSHDIRTPMNAIIGMTAIATAHIDEKERVLDSLGKITTSSRHLLGLINEVLDMNRIERGKMVLNDEEFSLPDLMDNLIEMVKPGIEEHHDDFEVVIQNVDHEDVVGDSLRLQQVFTNIAGNAIKYTPDGGRITVSLTEKPTQYHNIGCYEFVIEDNGIGMSKDFVSHVFEPFARGENADNLAVQGTGLGMSIAKNIVNMMNGTIRVESELNQGTKVTFNVFLRLQERDCADTSSLVDLPVLVVDDDIPSCESTVETLNSIGMKGEWVSTGAEAVNRVEQRHAAADDYYSIILDWKMPGMDGVVTAREIRKLVGPDITIIMLTSYDFAEIETEAREAGVNYFLSKPLFRSRLTNVFKSIGAGKAELSSQAPEAGVFETEGAYKGKRFLVVEDNMLNREIMVEIVQEMGAEIETAENGKIAVDKVKDAPEGYYDLIFMDIQMPVMNGYEATMAIRALPDGRGATVPIIALTANAFAEDVVMAKASGVNEHVAKPIELDRLNEVIRTWVK